MAPPTFDRHVVTSDGVRLAVSVQGDGEPLLMIPGLGATRRVYAPIVPALARHHRVIVYDPRGVGDSDVPRGPYPMPRLAADCVEVAAGCGAETFQLFGASMGGLTAQHVAVLHPGRLTRLILAATGPGSHTAVPAQPEATAALLGRGARTPAEAYRMACTVLYAERFRRDHPEFIDEEVAYRATTRSRDAPSPPSSAPPGTPTSASGSARSRCPPSSFTAPRTSWSRSPTRRRSPS